MLSTKELFANGERVLHGLLRLLIFALKCIHKSQVSVAFCHNWMGETKRLLVERDGTLERDSACIAVPSAASRISMPIDLNYLQPQDGSAKNLFAVGECLLRQLFSLFEVCLLYMIASCPQE